MKIFGEKNTKGIDVSDDFFWTQISAGFQDGR